MLSANQMMTLYYKEMHQNQKTILNEILKKVKLPAEQNQMLILTKMMSLLQNQERFGKVPRLQ